MQIGNRHQLDADRNAMRDAFDAIWISSTTIGITESRAIHCAIALDAPNYEHNRGNWTIVPGGRMCGAHNIVIRA